MCMYICAQTERKDICCELVHHDTSLVARFEYFVGQRTKKRKIGYLNRILCDHIVIFCIFVVFNTLIFVQSKIIVSLYLVLWTLSLVNTLIVLF